MDYNILIPLKTSKKRIKRNESQIKMKVIGQRERERERERERTKMELRIELKITRVEMAQGTTDVGFVSVLFFKEF